MVFNINIPCPVCQTQIPADATQLISGAQFSCPTCNAVIGLSAKSTELVESAMNEFNELKQKVGTSQNQTQK